MDVSDFDFPLPPELIAQRPASRGTSRMLVLDRDTGALSHESIGDLPHHLREGDVVVVNDTRVIPARVFGRDPQGRNVELLLLRRQEELWECLAKPGRRLRPGTRLALEGGIDARVVAKSPEGTIRVEILASLAELEQVGSAPLPPYIRRPGGRADARDREDYQTVFARAPGAVAAPTAGLHLTNALLAQIRSRGARVVAVTLHVGPGTFKPVRAARVEEHVLDPERAEIPEETAQAIGAAHGAGGRVVAVGTTTVRTLESSARAHGGRVAAGAFETGLFLVPGEPFLVVDALLTNFHLPRSTLLMLVSAFAGRERVLHAYREAVERGYRFFSYGDAMLVERARNIGP